MKRLLKMMSHNLTTEQAEDLKGYEIINLPEETQKDFSQVDYNKGNFQELLFALEQWINNVEPSVVLVQGEMNVVFNIVSYCFAVGVTPIFSTTKREVVEVEKDGQVTKTSVFKHTGFRVYGSGAEFRNEQ